MSAKLQLLEVPVGELSPNPWNTNQVSPENEAKLDESLKRFGVFKPILVRQTDSGVLEILGGEHRWGAAKRAGLATVPVINLGKIDERRAKEIGLIDNGRYGDDDTLALAGLLRELGGDDVASFLPYTESDLDSIFSASNIALDDLDLDTDRTLSELASAAKASPTSQVMRFKVPVEDVEWASAVLKHVMRVEGYSSEDSLSNAGNALVHILKTFKESLK
jgi:ParB family transcriptional regulator, chromosome partitioning protein